VRTSPRAVAGGLRVGVTIVVCGSLASANTRANVDAQLTSAEEPSLSAPATAAPSGSATPVPAMPAPAPVPTPPAAGSSLRLSDPEAPKRVGHDGKGGSESYRLRLIISDSVSLAAVGLGRLVDSQNLMAAGLALNIVDGFLMYPFVYPPGEKGTGLAKGFLSLVLRGGLSFGLCAAGSGCFGQNMTDGALLRLTGGLIVADAIDIVFLATRSYEPTQQAGLHMTPVAFATPQGAQMGMVGRW
jgi:hypothetical protein